MSDTDLVPFYDIEAKRVIRIPRCELAPSCVEARVEGVEGIVWVRVDQVKLDGPFQHPPFDEPTRDVLRTIQRTFEEFYHAGLEAWEEGFRRDVDYKKEIAMWLHAGDVYRGFTEAEPSDQRRLSIMNLIINLMSVSPDSIRAVLGPTSLSGDEITAIIARYHRAR
jgi:hypothetical protein